jgi:hypothetical protein
MRMTACCQGNPEPEPKGKSRRDSSSYPVRSRIGFEQRIRNDKVRGIECLDALEGGQ